ncbi:MAG: hypothetical protein MUO82_02805 [Candidatus Thermoplasmatota archaeon]|nr:hypothetical protein [Candidatus Thermoplasmatota archaeon]
MHPYSTDSNERKIIPISLAIFSVIFAWTLNRILNLLQYNPPWWFDVPSFMGFYGLLYLIFDNYLWRVPILKKMGLVNVPDLNGRWEGHITSSFTNNAKIYNATIMVYQKWTKISICLEMQHSKSRSLSASILVEDSNEIVLNYEYLNEPKPNARNSMNIHRGTTRLILSSDLRELEGDYYSGRGRQNYGSLKFKRS